MDALTEPSLFLDCMCIAIGTAPQDFIMIPEFDRALTIISDVHAVHHQKA